MGAWKAPFQSSQKPYAISIDFFYGLIPAILSQYFVSLLPVLNFKFKI